MKILFLTPRDSRKNLGGVEGHVRLLTKELVKRGYQVKEIALDEIDELNKGPAFVSKGRALGYKLRAWGYLWKKRDLIKWAEVIHVHDVFWWYAPFAIINKVLVLLQQQDQDLVNVTFHGWEGVCPPNWSAVWQKRLASRFSKGTIGVGSFYEKWYGVKTDRVVWGVVDDKLINRQIDKSTNRQIKTLKIIVLGRLEEVNGIEILLGALDKYYKSYKSYKNRGIKIIFVGDGSYRKQAEKFGKVTGMVKNPEKYLAQADVAITSSYMSMLEAAAMGKPIIAIANNPLKEDYLGGHPLRKYIKVVRNADELYKSLTLVIQGETLKDLEVARAWAVRQTAERLANEYEKLWRNVNKSLRS